MRSQGLQVAIIATLGALAGLLILRPWESAKQTVVPSVAAEPAPVAHSPPSSSSASAAAPPPTRTFKLPAIATARPVAATQPKEKESAAKIPPPPPLLVPKDWLVRGTGPQNYDVRSDRVAVFAGQASVRMAAHDKNVANTQFASLMQTVVAGPWVGKRIEFSANVMMPGRWQQWEIWVRATDAGNVVIAYDQASLISGKQEWVRGAAIIDVPWSASEIAYGINLHGVGTLNVDDTHLKVLDKSLPASTHNLPGKLGVVAQDASQNGPLAMPSNLDFEDIGPADEIFRDPPKDRLDRARF